MENHRRRPWRALAACLLPLVLVAAGCADDKDKTSTSGGGGDSKVVTIYGPEVEIEQKGLQDSFAELERRTGIDVQVTGDRSAEEQIGVRISGGNPPDIFMFPQPGKIKDFAEEIVDVPDDIVDVARQNFSEDVLEYATVDGKLQAIPAKADLKSLVWYSPKAFTDAGYQVPTTWTDFTALIDKMVADGKTPFCVGLGSDAATGWPFTDWIEDFMLRLKGPDTYDKWVKHEIPFNDPAVVEVGEYVGNLWKRPGVLYGGTQNAAATPFAEAGRPLLQNQCMMHRQGNFYAANWPSGTQLGPQGQVNAFYLPGSTEHPKITLSGGIYAAALSDRDAVKETLKFIAGTEYSNARAPSGGFLSPNKNTDTSRYPTAIEQEFAKILAAADPVRFDASDLMPSAAGKAFLTAAMEITTSSKDVPAAFSAVEAAWPKS